LLGDVPENCNDHETPMSQKTDALSRSYESALGKYLKQGPRTNLKPALELGRKGVHIGLETLELAVIHQRAVEGLLPDYASGKRPGMIKRAAPFFKEANAPIEETHRAARLSKDHVTRLKATLGHRTEELATTNRQLKRGVVRGKVMEKAMEKSGKHHKKCLEESLELQKRLRQLTHRLLTAQENQRKDIRHELQNEIAQTLLGINVRLLTLKEAAKANSKGLKESITSTQQLMVKSAKSVRQVTRKFGSL